MKIEQTRSELLENTEKIIALQNERETLVSQIQNLKKKSKLDPWDPKHELHLFSTLIGSFKKFSLKKALWLSLLIEMHCDDCEGYPSWSDGEHLSNPLSEFYEQINPILLSLTFPEVYAKVDLNENLKSRISEALLGHE